MSTQYEFMKRQVVEEVAALQEKLIAIQADCINRIKEIPVTSDLEDTMDELLNKISNQFLFQIEEPESASVVIGTARAGHFSWRVENGFRDIFSVEQWLRDNPEFSIYDEYVDRQSDIRQGEAESFLANIRGPFDLALLDPPFHHDTVAAVLPLLAAKMAPGGVVLCETEREADLPEQAGALTLVKQYNYGKIKVSRYERGEEV